MSNGFSSSLIASLRMSDAAVEESDWSKLEFTSVRSQGTTMCGRSSFGIGCQLERREQRRGLEHASTGTLRQGPVAGCYSSRSVPQGVPTINESSTSVDQLQKCCVNPSAFCRSYFCSNDADRREALLRTGGDPTPRPDFSSEQTGILDNPASC